jgi:hypothetical protein
MFVLVVTFAGCDAVPGLDERGSRFSDPLDAVAARVYALMGYGRVLSLGEPFMEGHDESEDQHKARIERLSRGLVARVIDEEDMCDESDDMPLRTRVECRTRKPAVHISIDDVEMIDETSLYVDVSAVRAARDGITYRFQVTQTMRGWIIADVDKDLDEDGDVDKADYRLFERCFAGAEQPPASSCPKTVNADFDEDGDVDLSDFADFALATTPSLTPAIRIQSESPQNAEENEEDDLSLDNGSNEAPGTGASVER